MAPLSGGSQITKWQDYANQQTDAGMCRGGHCCGCDGAAAMRKNLPLSFPQPFKVKVIAFGFMPTNRHVTRDLELSSTVMRAADNFIACYSTRR